MVAVEENWYILTSLLVVLSLRLACMYVWLSIMGLRLKC